MGKQAKKKQKSENLKQHRHNSKTRGINSTKRGPVWAMRERLSKRKVLDDDGKEKTEEYTERYNVTVPVGTLYDPFDKTKNDPKRASEPFDALHLDWKLEMMEYAAENNARIGSIDIGDGSFLYRVFIGDSIDKPEKVFFEVQSRSKFVLEKTPKRRKKA